MTKTRPLDGIRVIDFSRVLAGPLVGQILGDLGADVIKIERPGHGDDTRTWGPPWKNYAPTMSPRISKPPITWPSTATSGRSCSTSKKPTTLLRSPTRPHGRHRARQLQTRLHGTTRARPASLAADKPDIITATVTAFGGDTEAAHLPGYDLAVQGMSGIMHLTGEVGGAPSAPAYPSSTCLPATTRPSACSLRSTNEGRPVSVATSRSR